MTALTTAAPRVTSRVSETNFLFLHGADLRCRRIHRLRADLLDNLASWSRRAADMVVVPNELALDRRQNPAIFVNFVQD